MLISAAVQEEEEGNGEGNGFRNNLDDDPIAIILFRRQVHIASVNSLTGLFDLVFERCWSSAGPSNVLPSTPLHMWFA